MRVRISAQDRKLIDSIVGAFESERDLFEYFLTSMKASITSSSVLRSLTHSSKARLKEPSHLRDKLERKLLKSKEDGLPFSIDPANVFTKINDLAGVRLLHLHTKQIEKIHPLLLGVFKEVGFELVESPFARTWDDESKKFYNNLGIQTQDSPTLYTSIHYVVSSNSAKTLTGEFQVRTLMEEVWGEVDHSINYPHKTSSVACKEQILALARSTSAATRLVDAIFTSQEDHNTRVLPPETSIKTRRKREKT